MSVDAGVTLLSFLVLGNYWASRSVLYPPLWFCAMWLLDLGLYRLDLTPVDPIYPETILIISVGAVLFSLAGILALLIPKTLFTAQLTVTRFPQRNRIVKPAVTLFLLMGVPLLLWNLITYASTGVGTTILERARNSGSTGVPDPLPFGTYFLLWANYAATLFLLERRDTAFWIMTGIALIDGVLSTGRLPIMTLICSLSCVQLMLTGRHDLWAALKLTRIPIFIFIALFIGLFFVTKDASAYNATAGELIVMFLVGYIVGPTIALGVFLQNPSNYLEAPNHTFKFFLGIASYFHLVGDQTPPGESHIFVPWPTNVYTMYRDYISDFGIYGTLAVVAAIGLFHTMLYRKARTGSRLGIYLLAVSFYEIVMVIFADEYSAFGAYIDMMLFACIYIVLRSLPIRILPPLQSGYGVRSLAD